MSSYILRAAHAVFRGMAMTFASAVMRISLAGAILLSHSLVAYGEDCALTPSIFASMTKATVSITAKDRTTMLKTLVADEVHERAAGFQHVCKETLDSASILFVFAGESIPKFHMYNVEAALDIAFIDKDGTVVSVQTMQPYSVNRDKPLYFPNTPVVAALEVKEGFFNAHGISAGDSIQWYPVSSPERKN